MELGFQNGVVDDIFFVPGYDIHGFVVAQVNSSDIIVQQRVFFIFFSRVCIVNLGDPYVCLEDLTTKNFIHIMICVLFVQSVFDIRGSFCLKPSDPGHP